MTQHTFNGLPVGAPLSFTGPWPVPQAIELQGQYCHLRRLHLDDAAGLFAAFETETTDRNWIYLPYDRPGSVTDMRNVLTDHCLTNDPYFYTIFNTTGQPVGFASYLRINPRDGTIEVGWISMSPLMQRSATSTEAMYLMMRHAMDDLGYRRYEWKCDSLNAPSRQAALRLGFTYEGTFRQLTHYKDRNRDTAWFSILDGEWPALKQRFKTYLAADHFDQNGQQIRRLQEC
ncbi:MAG: GNAT family protein [Pseudomonadota bacterium]